MEGKNRMTRIWEPFTDCLEVMVGRLAFLSLLKATKFSLVVLDNLPHVTSYAISVYMCVIMDTSL